MTLGTKTNAKDIEIVLRQSVANDDEGVRLTIAIDQRTIQPTFKPSKICRRHYALEINRVPDIVRKIEVIVLLVSNLMQTVEKRALQCPIEVVNVK